MTESYDFSLEHDGNGAWLLIRWKRFRASDRGPTPWQRIARFDKMSDAELILGRVAAAEGKLYGSSQSNSTVQLDRKAAADKVTRLCLDAGIDD